MERCIYSYNDISETQHGFSRVDHVILSYLKCTMWFLDKGFQTDVIYLDFSKAFGSVRYSLRRPINKFGLNDYLGK